jgi:opacity protein-like surface antigen
MNRVLLVFLSILFITGNIKAQDSTAWSFQFGLGPLFPDASEIVGTNTPNGLNITAGLSYNYRARMVFQGTFYFDYFTDDKQIDFRTYVLILNATLAARLHILPAQSRLSPYLIGGVAPALYRNAQPYVEESGQIDPYDTQRIESLNIGYSLKYGVGTTLNLSDSMELWFEWQYTRFGFFKNVNPIHYRALIFGLLLDIDWEL